MWYGEEAVLQEDYAALQAPTEEETVSRWGSNSWSPIESCSSRQASCMPEGDPRSPRRPDSALLPAWPLGWSAALGPRATTAARCRQTTRSPPVASACRTLA